MLEKMEKSFVSELVSKVDEKIGVQPARADGLYSGELGLILFYAYAFLTEGEEQYKDKVFEKLDGVIGRLGEASGLASLISVCAGLTGLGWVLLTLKKHQLIGNEYDKFLYKLNLTIYKRSIVEARNQNFDYMHGSLGALTYLCEGDMASETVQDQVLNLTREILNGYAAEKGFIKSEYIFRKLKYTTEDDLNLGLAHGLSGILLGLLRVYEVGILQEEIKPVIQKGIDYILSLAKFENENDLTKSIFPTNQLLSLPVDDPKNQAYYTLRSGWCYGDLNQVILLYRAGALLDNHTWSFVAREIGNRCLKRKTLAETWIDNPFLCHGSGVVAMMFDNLIQFDSESSESYAEGREFWKQETARYMKRFLRSDDKNDVSFLNGLSGATLSQIALERPEYNALQKIMLLY